MSTTDDDAREFGEHVKHGGWRLGLLVARSVERGAGSGNRPPGVKISVIEFARRSGVGEHRVAKHLDAWEKAADAGHVPHAADLEPGQEVTLPDQDTVGWSDFYSPVTGGRMGSQAPDAVTIIERRGVPAFVAAMPDSMQRELLVYLTSLFEQQHDEHPIRHDDTRLRTGQLLLAMTAIDRRVHAALAAVRSGEVDSIDDDDRARLHTLVVRVREALDLLDMAAGGGVDDLALEAWLSGGAA